MIIRFVVIGSVIFGLGLLIFLLAMAVYLGYTGFGN